MAKTRRVTPAAGRPPAADWGRWKGWVRVLCGLLVWAFSPGVQAEWRTALPGWQYDFPRDHGNHPEFKTEWWYFTGNLKAADGRAFGYQLTFFRQGIAREDRITLSRFVTEDIKLAHFAVTDLASGRFHYFQNISRGAFGEAGFDDSPRLAWLGDWSCEQTGDHAFRLRAAQNGVAIDLTLTAAKGPVFHGKDGVSQKAEGVGRASHYYSLTRLSTEGSVRIDGQNFAVEGLSWFDHEWATNQLAAHQSGWDWFSLQFEDGSELMLFQLRTKDGGRDPHSAGTFVAADGTVTALAEKDFVLEPGETWTSPGSGGDYPMQWRIAVPQLDLAVEVRAALREQELLLDPIAYWEGAVRAEGTRQGQAVRGSGYLEMTGYAGPVVGMQAP